MTDDDPFEPADNAWEPRRWRLVPLDLVPMRSEVRRAPTRHCIIMVRALSDRQIDRARIGSAVVSGS